MDEANAIIRRILETMDEVHGVRRSIHATRDRVFSLAGQKFETMDEELDNHGFN